MSRHRQKFFDFVLHPMPEPVKCASSWARNEEPDTTRDLESFGTSFKSKITRDLIRADLGDECLQDALAILLFPTLRDGSSRMKAFVPDLMNKWAAHELPGPILDMREESDSFFTRIRRLYFYMLRYIQDYMMKATSYYLPRAYCMLPLLSQDGTCFEDEYLESDFDLGSFGMVGRRRLFWAFMRYELMSKIRLYRATVDSSYTPPYRLNQREGRPFLSWEDEALRCVQYYVSSLYAAHCAQWDGIRLPNDCTAADHSHLSFPPGLGPDYHSFRRMDWMTLQARKWFVSLLFMEQLQDYGFGLLTDLINDAKKAEKDRQGPKLLWNFLHELKYLNYGEPDVVHRACATTLWEDVKNGRDVPDLCARAIWQRGRLDAEARDFFRQRAWVFFDDARVHPQYSTLADLPEIPIGPDQSDSECDIVISKSTRIPRSLYDDVESWFNM